MTRADFSWQARQSTSAFDGGGFFTVVGMYDVIVKERVSGRPVTGGMVSAPSYKELVLKVDKMLVSFAQRWGALSQEEQEKNIAVAAETARSLGWS